MFSDELLILPADSRKGPAPGKSQRGSTSAGRNKFVHLSVEGMPPPAIIEWADALSQVDQSIKPLTDNAADRSYILPEPALFVNTTPERRRQLLHHWNLVGDGFYYMLGQPEHVQLLSAQQWRDVLEGRMAKRGAEGSRRNKRTGDLEELLRPALDAANVSSIEGFPVPIQNVPQFTLAQIEANVWRVAETSFRFELAALDRRAANTQRLAAVKACFAGGLLLGFPLEMAVLGWAAPTVEQRHPFVANTARLMLNWRCTSPVPDIVRRIGTSLAWSQAQMQALERAVCQFYTQAFWEYFGRAAVIPLRLTIELDKEEGEI